MEVEFQPKFNSINEDLLLIGRISECRREENLLLEPFRHGWKREVVKRIITDLRKPNCDIYYFHPSGKRLRSLTEVKANLTDGLTPECFTFKKEPLHVPDEVIRDAKRRVKKSKAQSPKQKPVQYRMIENETVKKRKFESKRQSIIRKKEQLKVYMNLKNGKQNKVVPEKRNAHKSTMKGKDKTPAHKNIKSNTSQNKKTATGKEDKTKKPVKENQDKSENETLKPSVQDIKSIVQKNIVKYREMRQKQMLGNVETYITVPKSQQTEKKPKNARHRSEPISSKLNTYLKPLHKGWRRELVHRVNGMAAQGLSDVYYFHPNGKKLRSSREVAENLTPGLTIECFTFRKEALGCGEPLEVVRNARSNQTNSRKK